MYTIQADAADESAIADVCTRAVKEHGRLDVFYANVCFFISSLMLCADASQAGIVFGQRIEDTTPEAFMNMMRVNTLS